MVNSDPLYKRGALRENLRAARWGGIDSLDISKRDGHRQRLIQKDNMIKQPIPPDTDLLETTDFLAPIDGS